jgi:hypothetical protein
MQVRRFLVHVQDGIEDMEVRIALLPAAHIFVKALRDHGTVSRADARISHIADLDQIFVKRLLLVLADQHIFCRLRIRGLLEKVLEVRGVYLAVRPGFFIEAPDRFAEQIAISLTDRLRRIDDVFRCPRSVYIVRLILTVVVGKSTFPLAKGEGLLGHDSTTALKTKVLI